MIRQLFRIQITQQLCHEIPWYDQNGDTVNAHGACIVQEGERRLLYPDYGMGIGQSWARSTISGRFRNTGGQTGEAAEPERQHGGNLHAREYARTREREVPLRVLKAYTHGGTLICMELNLIVSGVNKMNKQKNGFLLLVLLLLIFPSGCSNQGNHFNTEILDSKNDGETVVESSAPAEDVIEFTEEENNASLSYLSRACGVRVSEEKPKVVLDTDMTFLGDDAFCLSILVQADNIGLIDLAGVTVTGGNSFVAVGTNAALRQLELWGRPDIPVYIGTDEPLNGFRNLEDQRKVVGAIDNWGAMAKLDSYVEPKNFHDLGNYYERKWGYSQTMPQEVSAVEFLLDIVSNNKNEITIISVGSPISIALACQQDAHFAQNVNEIIYLGSMLGEGGAYTPYADFNCFYDATAYKVCLNAGFPKQTMIPHEVVNDVKIDKAVYDLLEEKGATQISSFGVDNQGGLYRRNTNRKDSCADAIAATIYLIPSVVVRYQDFHADINDDIKSAEYGKLILDDSVSKNNVSFVAELDTNQYWDFITDLLCHVSDMPNCTYEGLISESMPPN